MQAGDLSNVTVPRVFLVFEGALGFTGKMTPSDFNRAVSRVGWHEAWFLWDINQDMARKIWDVIKRQDLQVGILSYIGVGEDEARDGLEDMLTGYYNLPVSEVQISDPQSFARELSYRPDVAFVYDVDPGNATAYGSKGRWLRNVNDFGRF